MATISGGTKLAAALARIAAEITRPGTLSVGFLENATYPDGKPVAMIAAIQNFGAPAAGIPPRPFFSNMIAAKSGGWPAAIAINLRLENYNTTAALARVGEGIAGQLRQSIRDTNAPPLAASTLRRRGYTGKAFNPKDPKTFGAKPLVDTGHLLGSVDFDIR